MEVQNIINVTVRYVNDENLNALLIFKSNTLIKKNGTINKTLDQVVK